MHYVLRGKVVKGDGCGRAMGYPTANLDRRYFTHHPVPCGVWACKVKIKDLHPRRIRLRRKKSKIKYNGLWQKGIAVIGMKDRKRGGSKVEVYIIDFHKDIYGWYCEAEIIRKIRSLKKLYSQSLLVRQVRKDIGAARRIVR